MSLGALLYRMSGVVLAVGGLGGLIWWARRRGGGAAKRWAGAGLALSLLVLVSWALRVVESGHLPLFGTYESALSLALAVMLAATVVDVRAQSGPGLLPIAALVSAALLAHGLAFDPTVYALTISERSWAVDVHAVLAWAAFGALAANAALAVRELVVKDLDAAAGWLPRSLEVGFLLHTGMMVSGSFYKFLLFGKAWSFDPIETLGLVAWLAYGTLLHLHLFAGWRGKRLAGWSLVCFVLLVVSYRLIVYFPSWATYHIFDIDLRLHLRG